jgi:hypothetical protein
MKTTPWLALIVVAAILGGAAGAVFVLNQPERPVVEGVIYSVPYQRQDGGTEGFTRRNDSKAVPAAAGTWTFPIRTASGRSGRCRGDDRRTDDRIRQMAPDVETTRTPGDVEEGELPLDFRTIHVLAYAKTTVV